MCVNIHPDNHAHVCFLIIMYKCCFCLFKALQFTGFLKLGEPWRTFCLRVLLNVLETHNYWCMLQDPIISWEFYLGKLVIHWWLQARFPWLTFFYVKYLDAITKFVFNSIHIYLWRIHVDNTFWLIIWDYKHCNSVQLQFVIHAMNDFLLGDYFFLKM